MEPSDNMDNELEESASVDDTSSDSSSDNVGAENSSGENADESANGNTKKSSSGNGIGFDSGRRSVSNMAGDRKYYDKKSEAFGAELEKARQNRANSQKTKSDGSVADKNVFDKIKDNASVAKAGLGKMGANVSKAAGYAHMARHPIESTGIFVKTAVKSAVKKWLVGLITSIGCSWFGLLLFVVIVVVVIIGGNLSSGGNIANLNHTHTDCESILVYDHDGNLINSTPYDIEEYVAGVVSAETGGFTNSMEMLKTQAVIARTYGLNRATYLSDGVCKIEASSYYQNFNDLTNNSKADVYRQAANDTAGIVLISSSNNKFISTEYDAFCFSSSDDLNYYMAQKNQAIPIDWVLSHVKSSTWVACPCGLNDSSMTSCWNSEGTWLDGGHGRGLSQWGAYYLATQKGYTFDQILEYYYDDFEYASIYETISGTGSGNYESYPINFANVTKLNRPITEVLGNDIHTINTKIVGSVEMAGYGSGAAVASAAETLIMELYNRGYNIPYYWGGGHSSGTSIGVDTRFGSNLYGTDKFGTSGFGYDCSGFVGWAIKNACNSGYSSPTAKSYLNKGTHIDITNAKPGDLIASKTHVAIIVKNNGDGTVITAEAFDPDRGVIFLVRGFGATNAVVDMTSFYSKTCRR